MAVITGAASGIGRGISNRAVKEGMKVVLADIEAETLSQAEKDLKASGATVLSVLTDVSKAEDIERLAQKAIDTYGEVHLLCNNAGVGISGLTWEYKLSDWKWVMNVNLWGVIHGIRVFVPIMLKQNNECHIVNTSSIAGLASEGVGSCIYNVTKHGIIALSETLYKELEQINSKIKVSVLCPGFVSTKIMDCERNRPAELCDPDFEPSLDKLLKNHPEYEQHSKMFIQAIKAGISPNKVGDIVFQGIKNEIFYILTHTSYVWKKMVKKRMDGILEAFQKNKAFTK